MQWRLLHPADVDTALFCGAPMAKKTIKRDGDERPQPAASALMNSVAEQALIYVANQNARGPAPLDHGYLTRLHKAAIANSGETCLEVAEVMMASGIRAEDIADRYIPHIARQLGEEWCDDDMSFSLVSIGTARLQVLLRDLGREWAAQSAANPLTEDNAALVIVTAEVHHTLGSMVLAGQLRRAGLSVRLSVGDSTAEVVRILQSGSFDAVMISASIFETLGSLRAVVDAIRQAIVPAPPIVMGGTILDQAADVQALTGADLTTVDLKEALEFCDLMSRAPGRIEFLSMDPVE